ncbi:hypothetical protein DFJ73DRAFT_402399 [Zopfochytrium polystomum]|nr:hypothetical protein DFJ73DRAFT_402399 [Zopfochytrium polystomum]
MSSSKKHRRHDDDSDDNDKHRRRRTQDRSPSPRATAAAATAAAAAPPGSPTDYSAPTFAAKRFAAPPIDPATDYYLRSAEFIAWLKDAKGKYITEIKMEKAKKYFTKFARQWNRGELDARYYKGGVAMTAMASRERTSYRWKFKGVTEADTAKLYDAKDSVVGMTASSAPLLEPRKRPTAAAGPAPQSDSSGGAQSGANSLPVGGRRPAGTAASDDDNDGSLSPTTRARLAARSAARTHTRRVAADLEELAPKATGREAVLEKRRAAGAFHRREREVDVVLGDGELMGGPGESFQEALERERRRRERGGRGGSRGRGGGGRRWGNGERRPRWWWDGGCVGREGE